MHQVNTLRAVLVGAALVTAVIALALGYWAVALVLLAGCAVHGLLWLRLYRDPETRRHL